MTKSRFAWIFVKFLGAILVFLLGTELGMALMNEASTFIFVTGIGVNLLTVIAAVSIVATLVEDYVDWTADEVEK